MIATLYPVFRHWSQTGSVWIVSDTHFEDSDCKFMDPNWPSPEKYVANLRKYVHKPDTLIHLGDVGNPEWMKQIPGYKVLITGNHDRGVKYYEPYFDEVFDGPLFIANKLILSHEPIPDMPFAYNIHGHDHNQKNIGDLFHLNAAANVVNYELINLGLLIRGGCLKHIDSLHRLTIDEATEKKTEKTTEQKQ